MDKLLAVLKTFDGVEYTVRAVETRRAERYNIKKETEMSRQVTVCHLYLTLYKVFEEDGRTYRGSYATEIHPTATEAEMREVITQGLFAAGFVKNEYYPLPTPADATLPPAETAAVSDLLQRDAASVIQSLQEALHEEDVRAQGHLCYAEIFLSQNKVRIVNSNGVDVSYAEGDIYVETAVHWRGENGAETEIAEMYRFNDGGAEGLRNHIRQLFTEAEQRAAARPMPVLPDINILLTGKCLSEFFGYYYTQTDAQFVYRKLSTFEIGQQVQGVTTGDRITLTLDPFLPGSTQSRPYDNDGRALTRHTIIQDGKLLKCWGNTRFAHYLQIAPTGSIANIHITGGTATDAELRAEPYIELVSFSSFQMNPVTGDFASEIRLGYYFDGEKTVAVTGGSVSGHIKKVQAGMRLSAAERQYDHFRGPASVLIRGASIAGVE